MTFKPECGNRFPMQQARQTRRSTGSRMLMRCNKSSDEEAFDFTSVSNGQNAAQSN
jgi:hypothetical protein